jgi:hypothetical protein
MSGTAVAMSGPEAIHWAPGADGPLQWSHRGGPQNGNQMRSRLFETCAFKYP